MSHTYVEDGYVIKLDAGYYEINGLGDWTLAGNGKTAEMFDTEAEANEVIRDNVFDSDIKLCKVIHVTRVVAFYEDPLTIEQLNKIRELVK